MPSIEQLELPQMPISTKAFGDDPLPYFEAARRSHDWLAASDIGYVVTSYRAVDDILRLDGNLSMPGKEIVEIMGAHGTGWGRFAVDQMLASEGDRHKRLRGSVSAAFRPSRVKTIRPIMKNAIGEVLDEWASRGAFDFAEFAANFPVRVMFALLGTPVDRLPPIISSLEIHGESFNLEVEKMETIENAYQTLWRFVDDLIAERLREGEKGDLLDAVIGAHTDGSLSETELRQMLILLFAAGYDTTKNLIILLMHSLLHYPDVYARCAGDLEYCRKVVREQLRFATPSNTMRYVEKTFEYRGVTIPQGTMLFFPLTIAGRDPAMFGDPETFDPDRPEKHPTMAFGRGMHICLGQFLAIANVEEGIHQIAGRLRNPRLVGDVQWKLFPGVWGITSLPIEFDPA